MAAFSRGVFHNIGRISLGIPSQSTDLSVNRSFFYKYIRKSVIVTGSSAEALF